MRKKICIIEKYRKQLGWTQTKCAAESGVPQRVLSTYERGSSKYTIEYLFALVETFQKAGIQLNGIEDLFEDEKKDGD